MNLRTVVIAAAVMGGWWSSCNAAEQDARVIEPVHRFFEAFNRQDKNGMLAVVAPNIDITSMQQNALHRLSIEKLAASIAAHKGGAMAEHIYQPVVHVDNDLAVVWAPYKFTVDGKVHHCGTDVFTLGKTADRWVIIGISDNERKEHCE
ncbi:MAG TPA: nuclear transport factor 2 family protein [Dyella sp.]|nr:nuclear transport factor 2 family protein [Dyella sp.]